VVLHFNAIDRKMTGFHLTCRAQTVSRLVASFVGLSGYCIATQLFGFVWQLAVFADSCETISSQVVATKSSAEYWHSGTHILATFNEDRDGFDRKILHCD